MRIVVLLMAVVMGGLIPVAVASPWEATFEPGRGVMLRYEGVPIIWRSTLYVVKPGWTGLLFDQRAQSYERRGDENNGQLHLVSENEIFRATYHLEPVDDRQFRVRFEGELLADVPAYVEYNIGYFNADLFSGLPFRAQTREGPVEGRVPVFPADANQRRNELAPHWRALEFDSRIGKLRLTVDAGDERVMFFDGRRDPLAWAPGAPIFWCGLGVPERRLTFGRLLQVEMLIEVEPAAHEAREESLEIEPRLIVVADARSTRGRPLTVIPRPKQMELGEGRFELAERVEWSVLHPQDEDRPAEAMRELLESELGLHAERREVEAHEHRWTVIRIGPQQPAGMPDPNHLQFEWAAHREGYRIEVDEGGIEIIGTTPQAAFWGMQTLRQLIRPAEGGWSVPHGVIEDYPSMEFRGAHWFPSASGVPFHRNLIERIMGRYKFNHAVIQCEAAVWETDPEIAAPNSIVKEDLRSLVELSRRNFIEPIPLINVPGHAEWIFRNEQNLELAEDAVVRYAYCVNHPGSHAFITDILQEAIEVFEPSLFHMGHDEVTMRGQFPHPDCPRCAGQSVTELVLSHANRMSEWLAERDIRMMIWGDMLLSKEDAPDAAHAPDAEQARLRREGLPGDTIITDWHYRPQPGFPSLELFHAHGMETIASTWYEPLNIYHFSQEALKQETLGLLQTTWAGFFPDEQVLQDQGVRQFTAFILAAEYAWSGRSELPAELGYDAGAEFERAYWNRDDTDRAGALAPLGEAGRVDWREAMGVSGGGEGLNGEQRGSSTRGETPLSGERQRLAEVLFEVPEQAVVIGAGRLAPEGAVKELIVRLDRAAAQLAILNASSSLPPGTKAVRMIVRYADGSEHQEELVAGGTVAGLTDTSSIARLPIAWQRVDEHGVPRALRVYRWENPSPEKPIDAVTFSAIDPAAVWILGGMTVLD
jgi:hexosaminidase